MSIRPVSRCFPASQELWDATSLPMCVSMTPCQELAVAVEPSEETGSGSPSKLTSAYPKCLYCGALHVDATTHFRPDASSRLLCYLCGRTSSTLITDQQEVRENEYLDPDLYDKNPVVSVVAQSDDEDNDNGNDNGDAPGEDTDEFGTNCIELRMPLIIGDKTQEGGDESAPPLQTWQLPATACPPVWWIVVDGTVGSGGSTSAGAARNYWSAVGATLTKALDDVPPHVHVGMVTATRSRLASWDLSSAVPLLKQCVYPPDDQGSTAQEPATDDDDDDDDDENYFDRDLCLVPARGHYKANLVAAIRAMVHGAGTGAFLDDSSSPECTADDDEEKESGAGSNNVPLVPTLEILLEFMEEAQHPAQDDEDENQDDEKTSDETENKLRYAGGKILCLLGNPPKETSNPPSNDSPSYLGQPGFGPGGVAGACFSGEGSLYGYSRGRSSSSSKKGKAPKNGANESDTIVDPTDVTPSNLEEYIALPDTGDLFRKIGSRCAKAALGVDLVVLVPEEDDDDDESLENGITVNGSSSSHYKSRAGSKNPIPWYGLPFLRPLSDASGAPGPLMFGTANIGRAEELEAASKRKLRSGGEDGANESSDKPSATDEEIVEAFDRLHENILARTPWQTGMVFGVQLLLRVSPGYDIDRSSIEGASVYDLSGMLYSGGLHGPAVAVNEIENYEADSKDLELDADGLWIMGTCDPYTSVCVDIETVGVENGDVPDSCEMEGFGDVPLNPVMQTTALFTSIESDGAGNYYTVLKVRISSVSLDLAEDTESIYDGMDPEAVSLILLNKIVLEAYTDGFAIAQSAAESWLTMFMKSLYDSAKDEYEEEEAAADDDDDETEPSSAILEDSEASGFAPSDRLLIGQDISLEKERDIVLGQGHMNTKELPLLTYAVMQCDALRPSGGNFRPSMDARVCALGQLASMTPEAVVKTLAPTLSLWSLEDDKTLVEVLPLREKAILDAWKASGQKDPESVVLLLESTQGVFLFRVDELESFKGKKASKDSRPLKVGEELKAAILAAIDGYRTPPPKWKALKRLLDGESVDLSETRVSPFSLRHVLLEDKPTATGGDRNFVAWKAKMAEKILESVDEIEIGKHKKKGLTGFFFGK